VYFLAVTRLDSRSVPSRFYLYHNMKSSEDCPHQSCWKRKTRPDDFRCSIVELKLQSLVHAPPAMILRKRCETSKEYFRTSNQLMRHHNAGLSPISCTVASCMQTKAVKIINRDSYILPITIPKQEYLYELLNLCPLLT